MLPGPDASSPNSGTDAANEFPPLVPLGLQAPLVISAIVGAIAIAVGYLAAHLLLGALVCVGLGLGAINALLVQHDVVKITAADNPSKGQMAYRSFARLTVITAIALVIGFTLKPDGLGVFVGVALSQAIFVLRTIVPVVKGLRQQS